MGFPMLTLGDLRQISLSYETLIRNVRVLLQRNWGLQQPLAYRVSLSMVTAYLWSSEIPVITSGYRSPLRQKHLQSLWDAGKRQGLVARPATRSWHMQGLAVDVGRSGDAFPQRERESVGPLS